MSLRARAKQSSCIRGIAASLTLLAMTAFITPVAHAKEAASRVGFVDFQRALNEVEEGKTAKERLKKEFEDKQRKIEFRKQELSKMLDEVAAKKDLLTESDMRKRQQDYQTKLAELQQTAGTYQQELAQKETALTQSIIEKMKKTVDSIGEEGKFDMVLQNVVVYGPDVKDLTDELIKAYNKGNKGKSKD